MPAGYSETPLPQKLGIKPGHRILFVQAPPVFAKTLGELPEGVTVRNSPSAHAIFDVIIVFVTKRARLLHQIPSLRRLMDPAAGLWIAWPKKASGVASDITEQVVRDVALPTGLVDNKVCAIDNTWSGLRLVIRVENR